MKVTAIKQQIKRANRYSIYIDNAYSFSLSEQTLLDSKLSSGSELTAQALADYQKLSNDDKAYSMALRYVAVRAHTVWEVHQYLERKLVDQPQITKILNKLIDLGLLNDEQYAISFVRDRRLLRPTSRRKLQLELQKKRISPELISKAIGDTIEDEQAALQAVIEKKRRQSKYQDDTKLTQFLARQGFRYDDIKVAMQI